MGVCGDEEYGRVYSTVMIKRGREVDSVVGGIKK